MRRPSFALVLVALAVATAPLAAQSAVIPTLDGKEPKRPRLAAGADTNDASAYNDYADERDTPYKKSFDAYYWALRLEPAHNYYRLKLSDALFWAQSWEWRAERAAGAEFVVKSKESRLVDSLENMAYYRSPFENLFATQCRLDKDTYEYYKDDAFLHAWYYYVRRCYPQASEAFPKYLAKRPGDLGARMMLVRSYYWTRQWGNALREIDVTLDSLRARDAKRTYRFLLSKEVLETMRGDIYLAQEDYFNAKKAYGKALEENLTYWPAHVRLARAALAQNELPEALQEFEQAIQLAPDEATIRFEYGLALLNNGRRHADAEKAFRRALELEPHWAMTRFNLAVTLDNQGKGPDALAMYRDYLARAPRDQARWINRSRERVAALGTATTAEAK